MGKASSAKKIKRVQQAGVSRAPGQRRQLAYPALIVGILVVGAVLVLFARSSRMTSNEQSPTVDDDWYSAFGVDVCGEFQGDLPQQGRTTKTGIGTNGNGLIHIQPKTEADSGKGAVFQKFAASVGITLGDGTFTLPDGTTHTDGEMCGEEEGRVALYVWPPQANNETTPRIVTSDLGAVPFTEDGQSFVLVFAPRGEDVKLPPSLDRLDDPTAGGQDPVGATSSTTTTTVPGGASTTAPGGTTTAPPTTAATTAPPTTEQNG